MSFSDEKIKNGESRIVPGSMQEVMDGARAVIIYKGSQIEIPLHPASGYVIDENGKYREFGPKTTLEFVDPCTMYGLVSSILPPTERPILPFLPRLPERERRYLQARETSLPGTREEFRASVWHDLIKKECP